MKNKSVNKQISANVLAAFLEGNATQQECREIFEAMTHDAEVRELMQVSRMVDEELGKLEFDNELIPMTAMAASCNENNFCCIECEKYVLDQLAIEYDERKLIEVAIRNGWQTENGTALHNVGKLLEYNGLHVTRQYDCTIKEIACLLNDHKCLIAAVDGGELLGDRYEEHIEDLVIGKIPDHVIVILSLDEKDNRITIFDPNSSKRSDTYPIEQFLDAWEDSKNYLVTIEPSCCR